MIQTSLFKRGPGLAFGVALFAFVPSASAAPTNQPGWSATSTSITTGVLTGYETAIDTYNRKVYAADAQPMTAERAWALTPGTPPVVSTTQYTDRIVQAATGKVVALDADTYAWSKNYSFTGLKDTNGKPSSGIVPAVAGPPAAPAEWTFNFGTPSTHTGIATGNNRSVANLPYGVAVDGNLPDPVIVTTQTRTATIAAYKASQSAPTDADVIPYASVGLTGVQARTPVVDPVRHKAYFAGYNGVNGVVVQLNTLTRAIEAVIPAPGAVGLALDVEGNRLFVGTYQAPVTAESPKGHYLRILDLSKVNTSDPTNKALNAGVVVKNVPNVGENTRPGYDPKTKKVYLANSVAAGSTTGTSQLTVVDADPASAAYGTIAKTIALPPRPNGVAVDAERRLIYVPLLGGRLLAVLNADTDEYVTGVPTTGNAVDADVDPKTGVVFVSSQSTGTTSGAGQVQAVKVTPPSAQPKGETGPAGAPGAPGPAGAPGAPGKDGLNSLALQLSSLKLLGSKLSFTAPSAGKLTVSVKAGGRTIATGKRTAAKSGKYSLTLKRTKYGKSRLKKKARLSGTLTATFTPATGATSSQKSIKASIKR